MAAAARRAPRVVVKDPCRAAAVLTAMGMDAAVANEIAFGGDLSSESAVAHGRRIKKNNVPLLVADHRTRADKVAVRH